LASSFVFATSIVAETHLKFPAWWIVAGIPVVVCTAAEWASASIAQVTGTAKSPSN
jgi:hypothetical protein